MNTLPPLPLSRRRFLISSGLALAAVCAKPSWLLAQEESPVRTIRNAAASARISLRRLRGNVSLLEGSGGNIAVLAGPEGKLLVDTGLTGSRTGIAAALASMGSEAVKHLVNTHWHFDHTDGNEWLGSAGAEIVAHENTYLHLSKTTRVDAWNFTFPPAPSGALPTMIVRQNHTLEINGEKVALDHIPPAHTDSDLRVRFTSAEILHLGDTWWNGHYPFIDRNTGGSIDGMIRATEASLAQVTDHTLIIPGHGPVGNKADLAGYRDMLVTVRARVAALKQQGRTAAEVVAAKPTAEYDEKWGDFGITGSLFTSLVYAGV